MGTEYLVTIVEKTPTPDGRDLNSQTYHVNGLLEVAKLIDTWGLSFTLPESITIVPVHYAD